MSRPDVVCLGEAMIELSLTGLPPGPAEVSFAGDTFNTAVYLKRNAPDLGVAFATRIGTDRFSDAFLDLMDREELDRSLVFRATDRVPGLYAISTDAEGERSFNYWREASAARTILDQGALELDRLSCGYLYFSAISLAILPEHRRSAFLRWLPAYRKSGGLTVFDSNYRPALWPDLAAAREVVSAAWAQTDIALPSAEDEAALFGDASAENTVARLRDLGVRRGALKCGAAGPISLEGACDVKFAPAEIVVDSTAAGDSFNGAYLAAIIQGRSHDEALMAGHRQACAVIGARGAILPRDDGA